MSTEAKSGSTFDVVIIGSGPGGYVCAIRAAQLGLKTAIIEKDPTYGGTCLNVGCIPSKALLESSEHYHSATKDMEAHGIQYQGLSFNLKTMMQRKEKIVKDLTHGIGYLFKKNKIETFKGTGRIIKAGLVEVKGDQTQQLETKNIIIATGSVPSELPFMKFDEERILSSTGALALKKIPETMAVIGGGVIGLELGSVWQRLGSKVTVVEYSDRLCGTTEKECVATLQKFLEKQGMKFLMSSKVTSMKVNPNTVDIEYEPSAGGPKSEIRTEVVLVSTGRKPFTQGVGCVEAGIKMDKMGRILVSEKFETNVEGVFAIGDVIPGPMLAHKAEEEGVALAEILAGQHGHVNYSTVPSVIYTHPEIASVGLTEDQAAQQSIAINVGKFPFMANGRAKALGFTEGFVKLIADKNTDRLLGGHIVGPRASELLSEVIVTMEFGGSSEDLARSFHAHPTLSEVVREAALAVEKRARQM